VTRLRQAALLAFFLHLLAGIGMVVILRQGLDTNPDFQDRLTFLINHRWLWTVAWLSWSLAALAILNFYMSFAAAHNPTDFPTSALSLAILLTVAAVGLDLTAQAVEVGILPNLAVQVLSAPGGTEVFRGLHRLAVLMSGCVANGLYSLSALMLAWSTRRAYLPWVWMAGIAAGIFGLSLSVAALADSVAGMFWTNVLLVPSILIWLAGVATTRKA
jgi:hypothetical protein